MRTPSTQTVAQGAALLAAQLGGRWQLRPLGASGFTGTWRADGPAGAGGPLFVKTLPAAQGAVLAAEADGLAALAASGALRVPALAGCWAGDAAAPGLALLAIEWLDLQRGGADAGARLGQALGALHTATPAEGGGRFGWRRDNWLGATPQTQDWSAAPGRDGRAAQRALSRRRTRPSRGAPGQPVRAA